MIKTLQNTLKQDREGFVLPKSVQDTIPIRRLWPDGIFQFGSKFSKTIRFSDINYAIASKEDKTSMFLGYSELLNALDTGSTTKLTINNKRLNRQDFEQKILLPRQDDYLDGCSIRIKKQGEVKNFCRHYPAGPRRIGLAQSSGKSTLPTKE